MPEKIKLTVIDEPAPDTRNVIDYRGSGTVAMAGPNPFAPHLCCGSCGVPLVTGMPREQIINLVLRCKLCRSFNDTGDVTSN